MVTLDVNTAGKPRPRHLHLAARRVKGVPERSPSLPVIPRLEHIKEKTADPVLLRQARRTTKVF